MEPGPEGRAVGRQGFTRGQRSGAAQHPHDVRVSDPDDGVEELGRGLQTQAREQHPAVQEGASAAEDRAVVIS